MAVACQLTLTNASVRTSAPPHLSAPPHPSAPAAPAAPVSRRPAPQSAPSMGRPPSTASVGPLELPVPGRADDLAFLVDRHAAHDRRVDRARQREAVPQLHVRPRLASAPCSRRSATRFFRSTMVKSASVPVTMRPLLGSRNTYAGFSEHTATSCGSVILPLVNAGQHQRHEELEPGDARRRLEDVVAEPLLVLPRERASDRCRGTRSSPTRCRATARRASRRDRSGGLHFAYGPELVQRVGGEEQVRRADLDRHVEAARGGHRTARLADIGRSSNGRCRSAAGVRRRGRARPPPRLPRRRPGGSPRGPGRGSGPGSRAGRAAARTSRAPRSGSSGGGRVSRTASITERTSS